VSGATLGGILGGYISIDTKGLDFVMTALFVVIFLEQWLKEKKHYTALIGLFASILCLIGFGAESHSKLDKTDDELLRSLMPQDLLKYGLIPEFIGRLPVVVTLDNLDEDAFVHILTEPKNALTKQYEYLFALDDVILEFKEEALRAIARKAIERETGARGLRAIMEEFINPVMYEIPTETTVERCVITEAVVNGETAPEYIHNENREPLQRMRKRKSSRPSA
jgi:ATP-dependent Clp protease ATP-binding subunit ClpX